MISWKLLARVPLALAASSHIRVEAAPIIKQTISASTQQWEQACYNAGGDVDCNRKLGRHCSWL